MERGDVTTEAEVGVAIRQGIQPLETGKGKERILPWSLQEKYSPADTLIFNPVRLISDF